MSKRQKRHRATLERAQQQYPQGGTVIPNALIQQFMAQIQQQSKQQQGQNAFSPGKPLDPQNVNPGGLPIAFRYPVAYNVAGLDRSLGSPDIPPFAQLRNLADLYEGIQLCEKVWLDLIPRLQLKISLRPELVAQGAEEKDFQEEIAFYQTKFEKPDGINDLHSWLRIAITEQLQLDALYLHKQKTRGGQLQALNIIAGDTMKVLLDDWGRIMGYQQFPWGIPGEIFTPDQMTYFRESPRANTPYGKSRVERILMRVNQALRKEKKDLAHFTEGNQPFAMMEVPETSQWTPDQIEAFEAMWNSLIAGNVQQQVRVKFTQPGMKYTPLEQYQLLSDFDQFILNIATAAYGISLADLSFTGDIHKSSDDGQQNMLGRRTIYPIVGMYGMLLTNVLREDFKESRFVVTFAGFEEAEDTNAQSETYSRLTQAGILGLSNAAKLMKLPEDPNAPHIGRVVMTKEGPIFLDDMATGVMRNAAAKAKLTQLQQAGMVAAPGTVQGQQQLAQSQLGDGAPAPQGEQDTQEKGKTLSRYNEVHDAHGRFGFSNDSQSGGGGGGGFNGMSLAQKEAFLAANGGKAWEDNLEGEEKTAISQYTWDYGPSMNRKLRTGVFSTDETGIYEFKADQYIEDATTGLMKGRAPTDMQVTRFVDANMFPAFQANVGKHFVDRGFVSTTIEAGAIHSSFDSPTILHINVLKGTHGAYIKNVAREEGAGMNEYLLPPNAKMHVDTAYTDAQGNNHVNLTYVGTHQWGG